MSRKALRLYFGGLAVLLLCAVAFAFRPAPITGVDGDDLAASINDGLLFSLTFGPCERTGSEWSCSVVYDGGSSGAEYTVDDPDFWGCWTAEIADPRTARVRDGLEDNLDGCVTIFDQL